MWYQAHDLIIRLSSRLALNSAASRPVSVATSSRQRAIRPPPLLNVRHFGEKIEALGDLRPHILLCMPKKRKSEAADPEHDPFISMLTAAFSRAKCSEVAHSTVTAYHPWRHSQPAPKHISSCCEAHQQLIFLFSWLTTSPVDPHD